jgi:hypothetical protein
MRSAAITSGFLILLLACSSHAQELPSKIRGYKVYNANIVFSGAIAVDPSDADVTVRLSKPKVTEMGLMSAAVEVGVELTALDRAGKAEFMTFKDFRVNGIPFDVEEYTEPFCFKKGETIALVKPVRITIKTVNLARGALKELTDPKTIWAVTGNLFVFGKFKKFGFMFKRVIPVKVALTLKNPIN